jgi:hypothetical protein
VCLFGWPEDFIIAAWDNRYTDSIHDISSLLIQPTIIVNYNYFHLAIKQFQVFQQQHSLPVICFCFFHQVVSNLGQLAADFIGQTLTVWLLWTQIWNFVTYFLHPHRWQALWTPWLSLHYCVFSKCVTCLLTSTGDYRGQKKYAHRLTQHHHEMCHCITVGGGNISGTISTMLFQCRDNVLERRYCSRQTQSYSSA